MEMDVEAKHNLSQARFTKDRTTWADGAPWTDYYFEKGINLL